MHCLDRQLSESLLPLPVRLSLKCPPSLELSPKPIGTNNLWRKSRKKGRMPPTWQNTERLKLLLRKVSIGEFLLSAIITHEPSAAWDFYNKHKDSVTWDLSVLNPPYVCEALIFYYTRTLIHCCRSLAWVHPKLFIYNWLIRWSSQPILHEVAAIDSLNTSASDWANVVLLPDAGGKTHEDLVKQGSSWVDVRDLAEAHVKVLEKEEAGGERIIISSGMWLPIESRHHSLIFSSSGSYVWQDWSTSLTLIDIRMHLTGFLVPKLTRQTRCTLLLFHRIFSRKVTLMVRPMRYTWLNTTIPRASEFWAWSIGPGRRPPGIF